MRIALPLAADLLAPDYSAADTFALYDIHDHTRAVSYAGRHTLPEFGCALSPIGLRQLGVELLIAHHASQNALNHLLEYGILTLQNAPLLPPDALIIHFVSGTLPATPPDPAIHRATTCTPEACQHCTVTPASRRPS